MFGNISNNTDSNKISLDDIIELTKNDMNKVNDIIINLAQSQTELIPKISKYLADAGGKRIRPMLTIASALLFCTITNEAHIKLAAAVELMHSATLLHDDVVDESDMRRGKASARKIWGNQASVLVGDFLLGQAFALMVQSNSMRALDILSKAASVIAEGEVMQLLAAKSLATSVDDYFQIINAKTAELFAAATSVGAIVANASDKDIEAMKQYGQKIGIVFQLVDDVLDYSGDLVNLGKNIGDDFREGKITLPVLLCLENCTAEEKQFWNECLCSENYSEQNLNRALQLLNKYNSLDATLKLAQNYGEEAQKALHSIECDINKNVFIALLEVINFCIRRVS